MQGRNSGYFLVYRDVWKHKSFKNLIQASLWLYIISSASHKDKTLNFLNSKIFVKRGELIFPVRKNATFWKMTYSEMRTFILRLRRRGMIGTRLAQLTPSSNHPRRNITIISVINYDKFQYVDNKQPASAQLSPLTNELSTNELSTNIIGNLNKVDKSSKDMIYTGNHFGEYQEVVFKGKRYHKHRWKDEVPLKEIK
jgi:hypothetical protein